MIRLGLLGIKFIPSLAGGDGLGGGGGEPSWVWGDADAAEIEAVGIERLANRRERVCGDRGS